MEWIYLSLLVPFFAALNNILDQFLVRRYFPEEGMTALYMGSLTYLVILPFLAISYPFLLEISLLQGGLLFILGFLSPFIWVPYFMSLERGEASAAMPVLQLSPVMVFLIGYLFLGETITFKNGVGAFIIIMASVLVSYDHTSKKIQMDILLLMALCSFLLAIQTIFFRIAALEIEFLQAVFWVAVGFGLNGAIVFFSRAKYRNLGFSTIVKTKGFVLIPSVVQEISYFIAIMVTIKALETAPAAGLVQTIGGFHPIFVLLLSMAVAPFLKDCFDQVKIDKNFYSKIVLMAAMLGGLYLFFV